MTETAKPCILLVEDNMDWQISWPITINESISKYGLPAIEILQATNAHQANNRLEEAQPIKNLKIVVLDYQFPEGNGADFAAHVVKSGFSGTIIAASGGSDSCKAIVNAAKKAQSQLDAAATGLTLLSTDGDKSKVPELVIQALQAIHSQSK